MMKLSSPFLNKPVTANVKKKSKLWEGFSLTIYMYIAAKSVRIAL